MAICKEKVELASGFFYGKRGFAEKNTKTYISLAPDS